MGKHHIMLSYQWNKQDLAEKVYHGLRDHGIDAWMDTHGGVTGNINDRCACAMHLLIAPCLSFLFYHIIY